MLKEIIILITGLITGLIIGKIISWYYYKKKEELIRVDAIKRSRAVLKGQFSEQLAPYLPGFIWSPNEARFIGKPIDFIIFKGMDEKEIKEIIFLEIKTGTSGLNKTERSLRRAIEEKKVKWEELIIKEL